MRPGASFSTIMRSAVGLWLLRDVEPPAPESASGRKRVLGAAAGVRGSLQRRRQLTAEASTVSRALPPD